MLVGSKYPEEPGNLQDHGIFHARPPRRRLPRLILVTTIGSLLFVLSAYGTYFLVEFFKDIHEKRMHENYLRSFVPSNIPLSTCKHLEVSAPTVFYIPTSSMNIFISRGLLGAITITQTNETGLIHSNGDKLAKITVDGPMSFWDNRVACSSIASAGTISQFGIYAQEHGPGDKNILLSIELPASPQQSLKVDSLHIHAPTLSLNFGNLASTKFKRLSVQYSEAPIHSELVRGDDISLTTQNAPVAGLFSTSHLIDVEILKLPSLSQGNRRCHGRDCLAGVPYYVMQQQKSQWAQAGGPSNGPKGIVRGTTQISMGGSLALHANTENGSTLQVTFAEPKNDQPISVNVESSWGTGHLDEQPAGDLKFMREGKFDISSQFNASYSSNADTTTSAGRQFSPSAISSVNYRYELGALSSSGYMQWEDGPGAVGKVWVGSTMSKPGLSL